MITWITNSNLGTINTKTFKEIELKANSSNNEQIFYFLTSGNLPSGLNLTYEGKITGKLIQTDTTNFIFKIKAQGITSLESNEKEFNLTVNLINYKNIIVNPFLNIEQRSIWNDFINNEEIFIPKHIVNFENNTIGTNQQLEMLIVAGVEEEVASKYISAIGLNHKRKQFAFGKIKVAQGINEGTRESIYEAIYLEIYDPLEHNNKILPKRITTYSNQQEYLTADHNSPIFWSRDITELATLMPIFNRRLPNVNVDTTGYFASDPNPCVYFPSSISLWRRQIFEWREDSDIDQETDGFYIERNYLPLWMRSIQQNQYKELGYVPAMVLCYCIPGTSSKIIKNIESYMKNTGFNFNQFDFTVDRFQINDNFIFNTNANTL